MTRPIPSAGSDMPRDPFEPVPGELVVDTRAEGLKETLSTLLSVLSMLAISGGLAWGLWHRLGPFALMFGGALLGIGVMVTDTARTPKPEPVEPPAPKPRLVPGPTDAGNLHAKGPGSKP